MRLGCLGAIILLISVGISAAGVYSYLVDGSRGTIVRIQVDNADPDEIARKLSEGGVSSPWRIMVFRFVSDVTGAKRDFRPGTFSIPVGASVRLTIRKLAEPQRNEVTITVPEGSDLGDLARILVETKLLGAEEDLFRVTGKPASFAAAPVIDGAAFPFLGDKPKAVSIEGYLFPDTYRFFTDASAEDVVRKMLKTFDQRTAELRASPLPDDLDFHDVLTLASIVEAEVRSTEDRRKVADIFLRRLAAGIGLQADSTVNYATGKSSLYTTAEDRDRDSLWNTYKYRGLPPGPIGNPGLDAIRAVLDPTPNEALFFLTEPDGTVRYARTLEEHNANRATYLTR